MSHPYNLNPLLVVDKPVVDLFDTIWIFKGSNGIRKIHTMLAKILAALPLCHSYYTGRMVPDTGSGDKRGAIARSVLSRI